MAEKSRYNCLCEMIPDICVLSFSQRGDFHVELLFKEISEKLLKDLMKLYKIRIEPYSFKYFKVIVNEKFAE